MTSAPTRTPGINKRTNLETGTVSYVFRYRDPAGRQRSVSRGTLAAAEREKKKIDRAMDDAVYADPKLGKTTVGQYAEAWLERQTNKGLLKPTTLASYRSLLDNCVLPTWRNVPLSKITFDAADEWVGGLHRGGEGLSASRTRQAYHLFTGMLDDAVKSRLLGTNVARGVELPRLPKSDKTGLTWTQLEDLADACGPYRLLILLLGRTGLRWGEMSGMKVSRVRWNEAEGRYYLRVVDNVVEVDGVQLITTPKSHAQRGVPVPSSLTEELAEHLASKRPGEHLFSSRAGTAMRVGNFRRAYFDKAAAKIGMPGLTPHELRHTAASLAHDAQATVADVQAMLGHAKPSTTLDVYTHLFRGSLGELADRMDEKAAEARRRPGLRAV